MFSLILWKQKSRVWKAKMEIPVCTMRKGEQTDKFKEQPCPLCYVRLFCLIFGVFLCLFFLGKVGKEDVGYTQNLLFIFELIRRTAMLGLPKGSILFSVPPSRWELYQNWEHICHSIVPVSSFSTTRITLFKNNYFIHCLFNFISLLPLF